MPLNALPLPSNPPTLRPRSASCSKIREQSCDFATPVSQPLICQEPLTSSPMEGLARA
jgi:hypothetical protein